jgi:hypothetical protein
MHKMPRHLLLALPFLGLAALGACQNPRADSAAAAQSSLVGTNKSQLLQCAGAPTRSAMGEDGVEVLTYETVKLRADRSTFSAGAGWGWGRGWGHPGWGLNGNWGEGGTESRTCQASFSVKSGKIIKVVYGSPDTSGESRLDQCYSVIENCVAAPAK